MKAERDNPPFDRAPVDGYACKAEDLAGALPEKPVTLKVIREVDAGEYFDGTVQHGGSGTYYDRCGDSGRM